MMKCKGLGESHSRGRKLCGEEEAERECESENSKFQKGLSRVLAGVLVFAVACLHSIILSFR